MIVIARGCVRFFECARAADAAVAAASQCGKPRSPGAMAAAAAAAAEQTQPAAARGVDGDGAGAGDGAAPTTTVLGLELKVSDSRGLGGEGGVDGWGSKLSLQTPPPIQTKPLSPPS